MIDRRLLGAAAIALSLPALQGCVMSAMAVQAIPVVLGVTAMASAKNMDPWRRDDPHQYASADAELAAMDARIRRAECGDPESQYWLAATLGDDYNATPNNVEIYKWYRLAEMGDYDPATARLSALETTMSGPDVATARARAEAWRPTNEGCSARG